MTDNCIHLIIYTTQTVKPCSKVKESNFLCSLKRASTPDAKIINDAFQKQTLISVAGYICYYQGNKTVKCADCPKFEQAK